MLFPALRDFPQVIKSVTSITKFLPSQIETITRTMQGGKHMAKTVSEVKDDDHVMVRRLPNQRKDLMAHRAPGTNTTGALGMAC